MLRFLVLLTILAMNTACNAPRSVRANNNVVQMPAYTITIPPERGWTCQEQPGPQAAYLQFEDGERQVLYRVGIFLREIDTPERMALPAQELVDLYFRNEQKRMARADGGRYTLHDAVIATEELGGAPFHTLAYRSTAEGFEGQTLILLRVPNEAGNAAVLAIELRLASARSPMEVDPAPFEDVRAMAASLVLEEASFTP